MSTPNDWNTQDETAGQRPPDNRVPPPTHHPPAYEADKANPMSVVSCIAGLMGLTGFLCMPALLLSGVAIVTGGLSFSKSISGELNKTSRVMSVIGIVVGLMGMAWLLVFPLAFLLA